MKSQFSIFASHPELFLQISSRHDGTMKLGNSEEIHSQALQNREAFLAQFQTDPSEVVVAGLANTNNVQRVSQHEAGQRIPNCDGLITDQRGVYLAITVADCLPVILYHPQQRVLALLHAGWKGLDQRIIEQAIIKMEEEYDVVASDALVAIGPGIGSCHYEVHDDVLQKFAEYPAAITQRNSHFFVDLKMIASEQLKELGIKTENIQVDPTCTFCEADTYFSARKDQINPVQAMMVIVGIQ